jgi:hypothetical protein
MTSPALRVVQPHSGDPKLSDQKINATDTFLRRWGASSDKDKNVVDYQYTSKVETAFAHYCGATTASTVLPQLSYKIYVRIV